MKALVGYTGFVGSNLYAEDRFDVVYNSKNIEEAYGTEPDLLVYAGLRAEKYLANYWPQKDKELTAEAERNITNICPKKLVLISTIDVFKIPREVDEDSIIDTNGLSAYGYNRYQLEEWVKEHYPDTLIIRLPALFGENLKKNFIYDFIHTVPSMLKNEKLDELAKIDPHLKDYYTRGDNGFYKLKGITKREGETLKWRFKRTGFSAINFTDSRSRYQFYNLERLWDHMNIALEIGIRTWHPATEPVSAEELYRYLTGDSFVNHLKGKPADYDFRTKYTDIFGGNDGYLYGKVQVMEEIKRFVEEQR